MTFPRSPWLLLCLSLLCSCAPPQADKPAVTSDTPRVDSALLDDLQQRCFRFFWEQANPQNGLIADRARVDGSNKGDVASIASVGFGLSAICIADHRGWIPRDEARQRVLTTLRFLRDELPHEHGFFFHFVDMKTGRRVWNCELSSIDTALLMAGVLTARQYYRGTEIETLATQIYQRVDWPWMLNGGETLSMGWTPEGGFLNARWADFSEHPMMYLLGLASPAHPLSVDSWHAWKRQPVITYDGRTYMQCPPLFTHQYSHAWVDFRDKRDAHADYWQNSILATLSHRQFCIDLAEKFPTYNGNLWGITASDGPKEYTAWGGPAPWDDTRIDGVIVPCAAAGSIPFAPELCAAALMQMHRQFGDTIYKTYGFADAFNPRTNWVGPDVIGIDVGITMLMIENHRSGFVWEQFMANPEIRAAMDAAGFHSTRVALAAEDQKYLHELARDTWRCIDSLVEPATALPYDSIKKGEFTSVSNIGLYLSSVAAAWEMGFLDTQSAERRLATTLDSLEKLKTWHGFQQSWNSVKILEPATHDPWVSILDSGNLAAGIITVAQAFEPLAPRCRKLLDAMDWAAFYDRDKGQLWGGYNTLTGQMNPQWHLGLLGTDARLAQFLAIASGKVPSLMWETLERNFETRHHHRYLKPGWEGGGLFMQYISGLWLDERGTLVGRSAQNFAMAQMAHAAAKNLPAWGWSACAAPDGNYLGWGALRDEVVTPHASALAIGDFPADVVANLRRLEALGARQADLGFVDSVDLSSKKISDNYLLLDQAMVLLSLVNYLRDDAIRKWFQSDPTVQNGRALIEDYRRAMFGANNSLYDLRPPPAELRVTERALTR